MANKFSKNSILSLIKSFVTIVFPVITFSYASRVLGVEKIGMVNYANSITSYFILLASLGISTYAVRECSKVRNDRSLLGETAGRIISINVLTSLLSYSALCTVLIFSIKLRNYWLLICINSLTIVFSTFGADWLNTAMEDYTLITIRTIVVQVVSVLLLLLFVKNENDYLKYTIINVFASCGANIVNIFYRKKYCKTKLTFHMELKKNLPPILLLFAMILSQQVFTTSDVTVIGYCMNDYQVGLYSTAVKIYTVASTIITSITWVVIPSLTIAYKNNDYDSIKESSNYSFDFMITLGLPIIVAILFLTPEIITVLAGEAYLEASLSLRILAIALLFNIVSCFIFNINLLASGKDIVCTILCAVAAVINLITNIIFIPLFGITAAAATTCLSQLLIAFLGAFFIDKKCVSKDTFQVVISVLIGIALVSVCILISKHFLHNSLICLLVSGASSILVYFIALFLLKNRLVLKYVSSFKKVLIKK